MTAKVMSTHYGRKATIVGTKPKSPNIAIPYMIWRSFYMSSCDNKINEILLTTVSSKWI